MSQDSTTADRSANSGTIVSTRTELEAAFDELSAGETIYISEANAPYRTTEWLDIDVDGVTINGPGVPTVIKPADGANVGGIRIGHNSPCYGVDVRGVGYHGNPSGQSRSSERLHGIIVEDAQNVTLENNQIRGTYPRRHGDGGSGISVARRAADVRVINNRIHEFGDRGVQLGGRRLIVSGNVITTGLDRPIACDLWSPNQNNNAAQSVAIFGNLLGDSVEGSLIGMARNVPRTPNKEHVSIFGNVGFGSHKNFCHIRGPKPIRNVSVQNNVSVQETEGLETDQTTFAGIAVDVAEARNIAIKNNELSDYSGHGIHVFETSISDLSIQHNSIARSGLAGIHVDGATATAIDGNHISRPGEAGIWLNQTTKSAVRGNYVRRAGTSGILAEGSESKAGNDISANYITAHNQTEGRSAPAILVKDSGVRVRANTIRQQGAPAIVEADGAGNNHFTGNWADGERPWQITSPTSQIRDHRPTVGVHRDVKTGPDNDTVTVRFDRPFARPPRLSFGSDVGSVEDCTFTTDDQNNYVGVTVVTRQPGTAFDLFVDDV